MTTVMGDLESSAEMMGTAVAVGTAMGRARDDGAPVMTAA